MFLIGTKKLKNMEWILVDTCGGFTIFNIWTISPVGGIGGKMWRKKRFTRKKSRKKEEKNQDWIFTPFVCAQKPNFTPFQRPGHPNFNPFRCPDNQIWLHIRVPDNGSSGPAMPRRTYSLSSCQGHQNGIKFGCRGHQNGVNFGCQGHPNGVKFQS